MGKVVENVDSASPARYGLLPWKRPPLALGEKLDMHITPEDLNSVVFICEDREGRRTPVATGFFVRLTSDVDRSVFWDYVVTARHVIGQSERDTLYVRVNKKSHMGVVDYPTRFQDWHLSETADVAVIAAKIPAPTLSNDLEYDPVPTERFVGGGPAYKYQGPPFERWGMSVGIGDELFAPGLFVQRPGIDANLPVARFGHISQMPSPVNLEVGINAVGGPECISTVAYMAEFLSWGGVSGSPVFWLLAPSHSAGPRGLLGIVSAHGAIFEGLRKRSGEFTDDPELRKLITRLNSGMAYVTPADAILALLMTPALADQRDRSLKANQAERNRTVQMDKPATNA